MRNLVLLLAVFVFAGYVLADEVQPSQSQPQPQTNPLTVPQNIPFENCTKMFEGINKEKLFLLTLFAVNANNFTIEEIQSNNGYVIFMAARQKYLATVAGIDNNNSILKITPCNNIYFFQPGIVANVFKYIELNKNMEIK